ncbi:YARHG domain-containing protein [Methylobacterium sp. J-030]|uniref:YARHG domain-containing protein n=1 Tax=Methylobacterium sp. J-030 TaxID=2836627 RepID=UPI001FB8A80F|nr:YARHG domain-containing protein [Methylobacterium sp. J-030]MCJ2068217.1 YARHG domain-containing protein [Methylobacterium sp. J-030]
MRPVVPTTLVLVLCIASGAQADDCAEAWYQRNLIYKQAGYCFRTDRAIRTFGNAECRYDSMRDVRLSPQEQRAVARLQAFERAHACPP